MDNLSLLGLYERVTAQALCITLEAHQTSGF